MPGTGEGPSVDLAAAADGNSATIHPRVPGTGAVLSGRQCVVAGRPCRGVLMSIEWPSRRDAKRLLPYLAAYTTMITAGEIAGQTAQEGPITGGGSGRLGPDGPERDEPAPAGR